MIRPFHLRDVALVHRLGERGVVLHTRAGLTSSVQPLRRALKHRIVGGRSATFVWKSDERESAGFAQLLWQADEPNARIACLAIASNVNGDGPAGEDAWLALLDELVVVAGRRGVHNLIAEADEAGPQLPLLRRSGFVVYTRQDVWMSVQPPAGAADSSLRPRQPMDDWDIHVLYANNVPQMIQVIEPAPPLELTQSWVLYEGDELAASVHVLAGPMAGWMRLLIHPNAQTPADDIVRAAVVLAEPSAEHPLYCCVGRHQSWLQAPLERTGFRYASSQAVMVKHIARRVSQPAPLPKLVLEGRPVPGAAPMVQRFRPAGYRGPQAQHALISLYDRSPTPRN
ncbi:MAG: hypothetical protein ACRDHL_14255 [Candidatus Promineifilaceae bacterium]